MTKKQEYMLVSILSNFTGYPGTINTYEILGFSKIEVSKLSKKIHAGDFQLSNEEIIMIVRMLVILQVEIEDWEWETIMDEGKKEYLEEICYTLIKDIEVR